jgi:UDP-glucose 4-epimerase
VLRVSNAVGRWQNDNTQGIVSISLRAVRDGRPITLYGGGSQIRDYVDADDVAEAVLAACLDRRHVDRIWNVGSGIGRSVKEVIRLVQEVTGRPVPVRPARPVDVAAIMLNCTRIRRDLIGCPAVQSRRRSPRSGSLGSVCRFDAFSRLGEEHFELGRWPIRE